MFEDKTPESLQEKMLDAVSGDIDKRTGSVVFNALSPAAGLFFEAFVSMGQVLRLAFPRTSEGEYLEYITEGEGVTRTLATPTTRHFEVTGSSGQVTEGERFFVDGVYFVAQESIGIPGVFRGKSEEVGAYTATYEPETILPVEDDIEGLESIVMVNKHVGDNDGIDDESDESLLGRYDEKIENSPGPGNNSDYIRWAKEIPGVGNVLPDPLWRGPGTVRIVILTPDGKQAAQSLIDEVQKVIDPDSRGIGEGKAPPGAKVTVDTADVLYVTAVIPNLSMEHGYTLEQVKVNAEEALQDYLRRINPGGIVRIQEASSVVINASGVLDVGDILLNGSRNNFTLDIIELASLGEVKYT